jgi:hypothetical protein
MADIELTGNINFGDSIKKASRQISDSFKDIELNVNADTSKAQTRLDSLRKEAAGIEGKVRVDADTRGATDNLKNLASQIEKLFSKSGNDEAHKHLRDQLDLYETDKSALKKQLIEKKISQEKYLKESRDIARKEADARMKADKEMSVSIEGLGNAFSNVFGSIGKSMSNDFLKNITSSADTFFKQADNIDDKSRTLGETLTSVFNSIGDNAEFALGKAGAAFAGAIAAGGDLGDASKAFLADLIETAQKAVLVYSAEIFGVFAAMGPWGIPLGIAAIGTLQGMLALAKGALGADQGVIGINDSYDRRATSRDIIPVMLRKGESVLTPEFTSTHQKLLSSLYNGDSEQKYFYDNFVKPMQATSIYTGKTNVNPDINPELQRISKINSLLYKTLQNGISVTSNSNIKITDKTGGGVSVKAMPFR